jgi:phosphoribosyl-AMP cyclohydrolase / phosphoribosyl-ATP pyrophosphohydrolase
MSTKKSAKKSSGKDPKKAIKKSLSARELPDVDLGIRDRVKFDPQGLVPCIVQSEHGDVRMLGYMNRASLTQTLESGFVTFFSRSRSKLWVKGETSGNRLHLRSLALDCDGDTLLAVAHCEGPTCHTGSRSCFGHAASKPETFLFELEALLAQRKMQASKSGTYTEKLFFEGTDRIAKKVVEEAGEVVLAAKNLDQYSGIGARADFVGEASDLLFHLTMLLAHEGVSLSEVAEHLRQRHQARSSARDESPASVAG